MKKTLLLVVLNLFGLLVMGQDPHFSQYYASPLTLNPALTGSFNADFRVAANYRNQYFGEFGRPQFTYDTYSVSFDAALLRKKLDLDQLGVGLVFLSDVAGNGALTQNTIQASIAYHKVLDRFNRHTLSLGLQGGITQEHINFQKLLFESQYVDAVQDFVSTQPTGENVLKSSIIYPNMSIGVLWRSRLGKIINLYLGFVYANAIMPKESFLGDGSNKLDSRFATHGGVDIKLGKYVTLTPGFMFQIQDAAMDAVPGIAVGYELNDISSIYFGTWYRVNDAVIPMVAYEIHGFRVGASFDATVSDQKVANSSKGAFELTLIYIHNNKPPRDFSPVKFCPRF